MPLKDNSYNEDKHAFIIQLDDQKIFKVKITANANYYRSSELLMIGGSDICIYDNCNQNYNSNTGFPAHYYGPEGTKEQTDQTRSYLGGLNKFNV